MVFLVAAAENEETVQWVYKYNVTIGESCGTLFKLIPEDQIPASVMMRGFFVTR